MHVCVVSMYFDLCTCTNVYIPSQTVRKLQENILLLSSDPSQSRFRGPSSGKGRPSQEPPTASTHRKGSYSLKSQHDPVSLHFDLLPPIA